MTIVRSFDAFYRTEFRSVAGLAHVLTGNLAASEEIAQEAFMSALNRWDEIGTYDSPGAWVRRVVANKAVSRRRRIATERKYLPWLRPSATDQLPDTTIDTLDAIHRLSPRQAQAVALHYFSDLELADVAETMECSVESVRTHLKRARRHLADKLGEST